MSKVTVYDLEAGLPLFVITEKASSFNRDSSDIELGTFSTDLDKRQEVLEHVNIHQDIGAEEDPIPEWVKVAAKIGRFGEEIAMAFLRAQSFEKVEYVGINAKLGYDIKVISDGRVHAYEIKTTTHDNNKFYISHNELQVAEKMQNLYHLIFIKVDNNAQMITGYLIGNPINALDIDFKAITKLFKTQTIELVANQFIINISENFLQNVGGIPLNTYIEKVKTDPSV